MAQNIKYLNNIEDTKSLIDIIKYGKKREKEGNTAPTENNDFDADLEAATLNYAMDYFSRAINVYKPSSKDKQFDVEHLEEHKQANGSVLIFKLFDEIPVYTSTFTMSGLDYHFNEVRFKPIIGDCKDLPEVCISDAPQIVDGVLRTDLKKNGVLLRNGKLGIPTLQKIWIEIRTMAFIDALIKEKTRQSRVAFYVQSPNPSANAKIKQDFKKLTGLDVLVLDTFDEAVVADKDSQIAKLIKLNDQISIKDLQYLKDKAKADADEKIGLMTLPDADKKERMNGAEVHMNEERCAMAYEDTWQEILKAVEECKELGIDLEYTPMYDIYREEEEDFEDNNEETSNKAVSQDSQQVNDEDGTE